MKRWYVVQVYAGYEDIVKTDLEKRIEEQNLARKFWRNSYSFSQDEAVF